MPWKMQGNEWQKESGNVNEQGQHRPGLCQGVRIKTNTGKWQEFQAVFCPGHLVERGATPGDRETRGADLRGDGEFVGGKGQFEVPGDLHVDSPEGIR